MTDPTALPAAIAEELDEAIDELIKDASDQGYAVASGSSGREQDGYIKDDTAAIHALFAKHLAGPGDVDAPAAGMPA